MKTKNITHKNSQQALVLGQPEVYDCSTQRIWSFHRVTDIVEGIELRLSNMAGGFPFEAAGRTWASSEQLYLCGEFTAPTIQEEITSATSGYAAKRFIKAKYKKEVREDFVNFRLQWMLWCVWQKCKGNADFRKLLTSIPDDVILIEDTTTDNGGSAEVWGGRNPELRAVRRAHAERIKAENPQLGKKELEMKINIETNALRKVGSFVGENNIGKILMICRKCLIEGTEPVIDFALLQSAHIMLFGEKLTFNLAVKRLKNSRDTEEYDPDCMSLRMYDGNPLSRELKDKYLRGQHDRIAECGYRISYRDGLTLRTEVDEDNYVTAAELETFCTVISNDYNTEPNTPCSPQLDEYFQVIGYPAAKVDTPPDILAFFTLLLSEIPQASEYFRIVEPQ